MAFKRMKGVKGLVYVPENNGGTKKHPCKDCYACQMCSDNRCELCLRKQSCNSSRPEEQDPVDSEVTDVCDRNTDMPDT